MEETIRYLSSGDGSMDVYTAGRPIGFTVPSKEANMSCEVA
jgi:hypothetical protein